MEIAIQDQRVALLRERLACQQNKMLDQFKSIKEAARENTLLSGVLSDYETFYRELVQSKREQEAALLVLREYLESIGEVINVSDAQMEYLKEERAHTIDRLDEVRRDMQTILNKTRLYEDE